MTTQATFQPQNPALSHDAEGWTSCTAYSAAMAASFDKQTGVLCTGNQVRDRTGDHSGGLNLAQIDDALRSGWNVDLDTRYRYPFDDFASRIDAGQGAVLQGHCGVFGPTQFNNGASVNHAIFVPPGWAAMDPAADGRRAGIYDRRTHATPYPKTLLRSFAGALDLGSGKLGAGLVYASFTRDHVAPGAVEPTWAVTVHPQTGTKGYPTYRYFGIYVVVNGVVQSAEVKRTGGFTLPCTAPRLYRWPGHTSLSLVKITSGSKAGFYVRSAYAKATY